ncbi:undecaprenyl-diphosphatase [Paenibacillus aceris]|uniref:Undecaprenyl-diphosphatase n=1 Tax=Paenibacillus aceris TaxID=869555 RepID=A0ABS4I7D6_9BACL|nr:undecaprenyl-diphosphatase [Paenibacillus aceris]MBP1966605.1 undecaprenyl-diphosphatase [Paenibacillus aceris]NHW38841.1 undecaprenyl-diphosphatase [Paenibacillus aceris]
MDFSQVDYHWFQLINQLGTTLTALNPVMRLFASYAEYVFYLGIIVYWFTRQEVNRRMVGEAIIAACVALGFSGLLSHFFYRDRPFVTHQVIQLIAHPANASFPSDHAIGAFVIATSIWLYRRKDGRLWLALAACIAFSRIWTGVHYPSDVLAGAFIGMAAAVLVQQLFKRSSLALKWFMQVIQWYEAVESKIWRKQETPSSAIK